MRFGGNGVDCGTSSSCVVLSLLSAPSSDHHHHHHSCYLRSDSWEAESERIPVQAIYWGSALRRKLGVREAGEKRERRQARQSPRLHLILRAGLEWELHLFIHLPKGKGPGLSD